MDQAPSQSSIHQTASGRKRRILSGMRPTGKLHLGNYVGALANWVKLQDQYDCFFFIADWHALTTDYADTARIKQSSLEVMLDYLAAGLEPHKCTMFIQSHVPQHAELHLLLSMIIPLGWLERVPTYKEQQENIRDKDLNTYGFLGYPVLQSADIMMYQADFVPVGEDQVPHIEITREIARRFNSLYPRKIDRESPDPQRTYVFPEPQALLTPSPKLPGIDGRKMSKSYGNYILLSDSPEEVNTKLQLMVNDPKRFARDQPGNPNDCPVWDLHKLFSPPSTRDRVWQGCTQASIACTECKGWAANSLNELLQPIRQRRARFEAVPEKMWEVLESGAKQARVAADATMEEVRDAMKMSKHYQSFPTVGKYLGNAVERWGVVLRDVPMDSESKEKADWIREQWISLLPTDVKLTKTDIHRVYVNSRNRRVAVLTAHEREPNRWKFHPRDRTYEVLVLLSLRMNESLEADFIVPQRAFQPIWKRFVRDKKTVEITVEKEQEEYALRVPNATPIRINEFISNYEPLK